MHKIFLRTMLIVSLLTPQFVLSGEHYLSGNIKNLTAIRSGVMIMLDTGVPNNCSGTPYNWMLVEQEHTAITSVVLAVWVSGKKLGTVYTSGIKNGYCVITQFDPAS